MLFARADEIIKSFTNDLRCMSAYDVVDPIASGFAASIARPGGNITGFMADTSEQGVSGWNF
jgi:hypothetical protein